ncbi:hypothetical protein CPLU01_11833 [Colletotrichum plurivorum]|uniref:Uncharacterized protein n=1 Tax=Colletotrichum plurivorum TaxID=2175906 RepID=A0A8H6N7P0_9PEZI|nr:hypothetical protein CPLU01_11833 [Colletotrichum plurivorum]
MGTNDTSEEAVIEDFPDNGSSHVIRDISHACGMTQAIVELEEQAWGRVPATESATPSSARSSNEELSDIETNDVASVAISPHILTRTTVNTTFQSQFGCSARGAALAASQTSAELPNESPSGRKRLFPPNTTRLQTNRICET